MEPMERYETIDEKRAFEAAVSSFMTKVYGRMCLALLITALTAWVVSRSESAMYFIFGSDVTFYGLLIAELALVIIISRAINKISSQTAMLLFVVYSLLTGVTMAAIFWVFEFDSIASTFCVTGATFGIMSLYGMLTKKDLSGWGNLLFMALIGLIIASVVNLIWANSALYWITTYVGIIVFVGLTAYDTQKLKRLSVQVGEGESAAKLSVIGALELYLDFINLFLYLLRLLGRRK